MRFKLSIVIFVVVLAGVRTANAQLTPPADAFEDDAARELVMTYLQAATHRNHPRDSYQALLRSRTRMGVYIPWQWLWRDRVLFHKETAGMIDFYPDNPEPRIMLGKTRGAPVIGDQVLDDHAWFNKIGFDPEKGKPAMLGLVNLAMYGLSHDMPLSGPPSNTMSGLDSTWVNPLTVSGLEHYVYSNGRPLDDSDSTLASYRTVNVHTKMDHDHQVVGAIWFDETGAPVRAMYRPRGRWKLRSGFAGFISAIPLLQKNALGEIDFLTIEYGYGTPARPIKATMSGRAYWFYSQAIMPITSEWTLDWDESYDSPNIQKALAEADGGIRTSDDGTWPVLPDTAFGATWLVPPPIEQGQGFDVRRDDLTPYVRELNWINGRPPAQGVGRTLGSFVGSVRFNQVQGVNFTLRYPWFLSPNNTLNMRMTVPTSGFQVTGEVRYRSRMAPHFWYVQGYSKLKDANWYEHVNTFFSSLNAILTGYDDGNYYLASGVSWGIGSRKLPLWTVAEVYAEYQQPVEKTETYSLFGPPDPPPPPPLVADLATEVGIRAVGNIQIGDDAQKGVFVGRGIVNTGVGDFSFISVSTINDIVGPLFWHIDGAARLSFGYAWGGAPTQSLWYLGGVKTIRGYAANSASGEGMYMLRLELGTDVPLFRIVVFADVGNAGASGTLYKNDPLVGVGPGISLFDGIVRMDFAWGLTRNGTFRLTFTTSGLF